MKIYRDGMFLSWWFVLLQSFYVVNLWHKILLSHSLWIHKMQIRQYDWHCGQISIVTTFAEDTFSVSEETSLKTSSQGPKLKVQMKIMTPFTLPLWPSKVLKSNYEQSSSLGSKLNCVIGFLATWQRDFIAFSNEEFSTGAQITGPEKSHVLVAIFLWEAY